MFLASQHPESDAEAYVIHIKYDTEGSDRLLLHMPARAQLVDLAGPFLLRSEDSQVLRRSPTENKFAVKHLLATKTGQAVIADIKRAGMKLESFDGSQSTEGALSLAVVLPVVFFEDCRLKSSFYAYLAMKQASSRSASLHRAVEVIDAGVQRLKEKQQAVQPPSPAVGAAKRPSWRGCCTMLVLISMLCVLLSGLAAAFVRLPFGAVTSPSPTPMPTPVPTPSVLVVVSSSL